MQKSCYKFISMHKRLYHVNGFTLQTHIGFMLQNGDEQRLCLNVIVLNLWEKCLKLWFDIQGGGTYVLNGIKLGFFA
jgi:hypothetical protein